MSEENSTKKPVSASPDTSPKPKTQNRLLVGAGGLGCLALVCMVALVCGGILAVRFFSGTGSDTEPVAADVSVEDEEITVEESTNIQPLTPTPHASKPVTVTPQLTAGSISPTGPELGPVTFSLTPKPDEPAYTFEEGVTQIHALFDYNHLSPESTFTQVWYYNGTEILSNSLPWPAAEEGRYDYLIEAGGDPLPAGQWALEFYIDDNLLTAGSFVVESPAVAVESTSPITETLTLDDLPRIYKLAYTKWNGEGHDLYVANTDGSGERFIMRRAAGPSWSADGRYLFFYGEEGVDQQVINGNIIPLADVSNGLIRLNAAPLPTSVNRLQVYQGYGWNDGSARYASVSPDGTMIAYDGDRGGGRRIYFLGTDANQQFRYELIGEQADWSPDSQRVVYRSERNNQVGIWISNREDTGHVRITTGGTDSFPAWSPDGKTIAFSRDVGGNVDIYTVNVDGSNLQQLTTAPGHDTLPAFLPNGDLVFRSARGGSWGIWTMKADGSDQTQIIANAPVGPDWVFSKMSVLR